MITIYFKTETREIIGYSRWRVKKPQPPERQGISSIDLEKPNKTLDIRVKGFRWLNNKIVSPDFPEIDAETFPNIRN